MYTINYYNVSEEHYKARLIGKIRYTEFVDDADYTIEELFAERGVTLEKLDNGDYTYETGSGRRYVRQASVED